ncbi:uncharacterized protein MONBRDRAFT_33343 [Monosiga brevicollis MX1]|uniref:Sulfatase-modifying factor enzyme-like domain-containing protein n=1 Tax=Monosiga brevicollis TaxID=81824 RepID=A9V4V4_MONBE|nr:uncharacterized protein MONBRDRAFT_33343 [Monosiga brevicollis MX1]EDQ87521.1 predicted protein [Monosiga brevicollis MX1]|eukprot:XP_001747781.1 hypothetical protein [Monosiga brevicollis MX1]
MGGLRCFKVVGWALVGLLLASCLVEAMVDPAPTELTPDDGATGCGADPAFGAAEEGGGSCGCGALNREPSGDPNSDDLSAQAESAHDVDKYAAQANGHGESEEQAALLHLSGGVFTMGSDDGFFPDDGEGPARKVQVSPFLIGAHEVSNARFAAFVAATGYRTEAERFGNSFVVEQFISPRISAQISSAVAAAPWWLPVDGADWAHPEGPDTNISGRADHPAVHISWNDANAFCRWSHPRGRLPTEAEWEFAARGGLEHRLFPWGNKMQPKGEFRMNTWQSEMKIPTDANVFKHSFLPIHDGHAYYSAKNTAEDGFQLTAPVDSYKPNKFGLYNTVGNVWEWTNDWHTRVHSPDFVVDPRGPPAGDKKVKKGGSFMCNIFTCYRYRNSARMPLTPDSSAANVGFRCAADVSP